MVVVETSIAPASDYCNKHRALPMSLVQSSTPIWHRTTSAEVLERILGSITLMQTTGHEHFSDLFIPSFSISYSICGAFLLYTENYSGIRPISHARTVVRLTILTAISFSCLM